jgi:hypothetical protein
MYELNGNKVTASIGGAVYTIERRADGFRAWCVNASSRAYNRGFAKVHTFATPEAVEAKYKRLPGVAAVLKALFVATPATVQ